MEISPNAKAILLLTAPLILGRGKPSANPLSAAEYRRLARRLRELGREPADLLKSCAEELIENSCSDGDCGRIEQLLGRGFLLAQAIEHWRTRAIWVVSRADTRYPRRLKKLLGEDAPPILYGGGDATILDNGSLAVVGSRYVDDVLIEYTEDVGRLAALARRTIVSGGARGIDQAAMRGALQAGGQVAGILADGLERAVMRREHRGALLDGRLVLVSPYDPAARFNVGHAMQRNKLIYALSESALVVSSDHGRGGTWTGATEQLDKLKFVPVFARAGGGTEKGLAALLERGALPWPDPTTPKALEEILESPPIPKHAVGRQGTLSPEIRDESSHYNNGQDGDYVSTVPEPKAVACSLLADDLFATVRALLERLDLPGSEARVAEELQITKKQADIWMKRFAEEKVKELFRRKDLSLTEAEVADALRIPRRHARHCLKHLIEEGMLEKHSRPSKYRSTGSIGPLFDHQN